MARPLAIIEQEIRELSVSDKEALLRVLWEELDGPADIAVDAAWLEDGTGNWSRSRADSRNSTSHRFDMRIAKYWRVARFAS